MGNTVISIENLSKSYRLGQIGTGTFSRDLEVWLAKMRGKPNPLMRIGDANRANRNGEEMWALRDINFTVEQGEVLGIIGRNGAGKSTLLKILSRVTAPTSGRIKVKGRIASLLEVGTGFHPELTGRENIYLNGAILGMNRQEIESKFEEIVDFAEVEKFIDTPVKRYSSGMYVRLAFAVAAHMNCEILVVDEVLAVGDIMFQIKCMNKMQDVSSSGRTVMFVSHDMGGISRLTQRSVVLNQGRLQFSGLTADAINLYTSQVNPSVVELGARTDRTGDGLIRLTSMKICNDAGAVVTSVGTGATVSVVIGYEVQSPNLDSESVALDVRFTDSTNHPVATVSTRFAPFRAQKGLGTAGVFICRIPALLFSEGVYGIDLWLAYRGGISDCIMSAGELEVHVNDYYGSGQEPVRRKHGAALLQHEWELG